MKYKKPDRAKLVKWSECPRCGSNRVVLRCGMGTGFFSSWFHVIFGTTIAFFLFAFIYPPLAIPAMIFVGVLLSINLLLKGYHCRDCKLTWRTEADKAKYLKE